MSLILTKDKVAFVTNDGDLEFDISSMVRSYNIFRDAENKGEIDLSIIDDSSYIETVDLTQIQHLRDHFDKIIKKRNLAKL